MLESEHLVRRETLFSNFPLSLRSPDNYWLSAIFINMQTTSLSKYFAQQNTYYHLGTVTQQQ